MENTKNQQGITLSNILNAFKKNIITIIYFLLSSLLIGFVYTGMQEPEYSSTATLISKTAINAATESQITSSLTGEKFISGVAIALSGEGINTLEGTPITEAVLGNAISGKLLVVNGAIYNITFVSKEKDAIVQILTIIREEFINYLRGDTLLSAIGNNFDFNSSPTKPVSLTTSKNKVLLITAVIGVLFAAVVIFLRDVLGGTIYDKRDVGNENLLELKLPKRYKKITKRNFMSWPALPTDISKALTDGENKEIITFLQDEIISKVGFDNNVQVFYATTNKNVHEQFIKAYAQNFKNNGKKVIVINLYESTDKVSNLKEEIAKEMVPEALEENFNILGFIDEHYPSSVVNNSTFLDYINHVKKEYDFVVINGGTKVEQYRGVLSRLADPIVNVYSVYTRKRDYQNNIEKLNNEKTITLIVG